MMAKGPFLTHKGQSSFDIRFPKADIREIALTDPQPSFKVEHLSDCFNAGEVTENEEN
jgi:hypothetical protein